jgi:DNA topoisomerase I
MRDTTADKAIGSVAEQNKEVSIAAGLVYVSDAEPGISRIRRGSGFRYVSPNGKPIRDTRELARIAKLAIPPAYTDVWICTHPRGHLQATGRDARGRKQYRYHPVWRESRDCSKFQRVTEFGTALARLRRRTKADLALPGLPRDKVLAAIATLLDRTRVRVGNLEYVRANGSFGLTTLRDRHAKFLSSGCAVLRFRGKGGVEHEVKIDDRRLAAIVHRCQELPGQRLFQYIDEDGGAHTVDSAHVNDYLREVMGNDFTAKDFRTWNATLRAIELLRDTPLPMRRSERACKTCILCVIRKIAAELRNTPAVCRKSYIAPVVFAAWQDGSLQRILRGRNMRRPADKERAALRFLRECNRET